MGKVFKKVEKEYDLLPTGATSVTYEVPQVEDWEDVISFFGSETTAIDRINTVIERSALQNGNLKFKDAPEAGWNPETIAEATAKAQTAVREYTTAKGGPSKAAKADAFDNLIELAKSDFDSFKSMSQDELLAKLAELTKKA